ncbi:hypothetical protein [Brevundimonas diminuta]|uniref:hypothetical protein n=1 Tax=Brevundimonas diminuta TaxID=293 RepID=UPI0030F7FC18
MTHPLTPREKVDCVACEGRPAPENNPCAVCGRTAIASGSGDHAELARLVESLRRGKVSQGDRIRVATLSEAILAENAALRAACDGMVEEVSRSQARLHAATKAERKLAEADRAARQIVELKIPPGNDPEQRLKLLSLLAKAQVIARTFLSKEAERG